MARLIAAVMISAALFTWSCGPNPTAEDTRRLQQLQIRHGKHYEFKLAEDTYIEATNRVAVVVDKNEAIEIYRDFWFTDNTERGDSHYIYLNIYNRDGDFQYQLFWDRESRRFVAGNRDHY